MVCGWSNRLRRLEAAATRFSARNTIFCAGAPPSKTSRNLQHILPLPPFISQSVRACPILEMCPGGAGDISEPAMQQRRRLACVLASLAALAIVGCSGHSPAPGVDPSERNLRLIWTAWFVSKKAPQQAPKQWEDLARYIDDDDPNSVRTSPNDHQP